MRQKAGEEPGNEATCSQQVQDYILQGPCRRSEVQQQCRTLTCTTESNHLLALLNLLPLPCTQRLSTMVKCGSEKGEQVEVEGRPRSKQRTNWARSITSSVDLLTGSVFVEGMGGVESQCYHLVL